MPYRQLDEANILRTLERPLRAIHEVRDFTDEVLMGAVNEIETLTTGLLGKIWQKIRLIERGGILSPTSTEQTV